MVSPNSFTLSAMLKAFSNSGDVENCLFIIQELEKQGQELTVFTYIHVINACIKRRDLDKALEVVEQMKRKGIKPNFGVFIPLLKEATLNNNSKIGLELYTMIKMSKLSSPQLSMTILSFGLKVKNPNIVIEECERMKRNSSMTIISWSFLIQAWIEMNDISKAINIIEEMKINGVEPNSTTFTILLTACAKEKLYAEGESILLLARNSLQHFSIELSNSMLNFYTKCGYPEISIKEGESLTKKKSVDVVTFNCLIQAHIEMKDIKSALKIIEEMKRNDIQPNATSFTILLTACTNMKLFNEGKLIHEMIVKTLKYFGVELYNTIINFYSKSSGRMGVKKAISIMEEMIIAGINPDSTTFTILISGCADFDLFEEGKEIIEMAQQHVHSFSLELGNSVLIFYSKCNPNVAIEYFAKEPNVKDVTSWNILIQAYIRMNNIKHAINCIEMMKSQDFLPNATTFVILLTGCADLGFYHEGKALHDIAKKSIHKFPLELSVSVLNFYSKCGHPEISLMEGESLKKTTNVAIWNCLLQAHLNIPISSRENLSLTNAMKLYSEMKEQSIKPDKITFIILLSACGESLAADFGKAIIKDIKVEQLMFHEEITSVMMYFYSRIGDHQLSQQLLTILDKKLESKEPLSIITFNNMLMYYAHIGNAPKAQLLFDKMVQMNIQQNVQTFTIMLTVFSHCGMVEEAIQIYQEMKSKFQISPNMITDCAMVDVLSRAGRFEEAEQVISGRMDVSLWGALMGGCRKYNNVVLGERIFKVLSKIDETNASAYVLLSQIYKHQGLEEKAEQLRQIMQKRGIKKVPGIVNLYEEEKVFQFSSGSTSCDRIDETERMRKEIYQKISEAGFKSDIGLVTKAKELTDEEKETILLNHAEKTAIAHAFVLNPNRKQIILTSNLRVCNDCHSAIEYISKVMNVEIIIKDANRYHLFKEGKCSCNGFW